MSGLPESEVGTENDPLFVAMEHMRLRQELSEFKRMRRVLLIEDDEGVRVLFGRRAESFNCEVVYASNGADGIQQALEGAWDLIVIDIMLPGGPDGIAVFQEIRTKRSRDFIPVAFFAGRLDYEQARRVEEIGFAPFVQKPLNPSAKFFASFLHTFGIREKEIA